MKSMCAACNEPLTWSEDERAWLHASELCQCVSLEACTVCGEIVDYFPDCGEWKHSGTYVSGLYDAAKSAVDHAPTPECGMVATPTC